jgi:hypothetical protein
MLQILKKIALGIIIFVATTTIIAAVLTYTFQDKLKSIAIQAINENIKVPITVKGKIDITFLRSFPNVGVTLNEVYIDDYLRKNEKLLTISKASFLFDIYEVMYKDVSIKKIILENGQLNLYNNAKGENNYDIIKKNNSGESKGVNLNSIILKNINLSYNNKQKLIQLKTITEFLEFKGKFRDSQFDMSITADIYVKKIILQQDTLSPDKKLKLDFTTKVNKVNNSIYIKNSTLTLGENIFVLDGLLDNTKNKEKTTLSAQCKGKEIATLIELLPNSIKKNMEGIKGKGAYEIDIQYNSSTKNKSLAEVKATLKNATIKMPKLSNELSDVNAVFYYSSQLDKIEISNFNCSYENKPLNFSLTLQDISKEISFRLNANGIVNLNALEKFIPSNNVKNIKGELSFDDFRLAGKLNSQRTLISNSIDGSGAFKFIDVSLEAENILYENINGSLTYNQQTLIAKNLIANFLGSQFLFNGNIQKLFTYISERVKRSGNTSLGVEGKLFIKTFNLTEIIKITEQKQNKAKKNEIDIADIFQMQGNLELSIDEFIYNKLRFTTISGQLGLSPKMISLNDLNCNAMSGDIQYKGFINFTSSKDMQINGNIKINKIDIKQLFEQADNFGQNTLTYQHLKGKINVFGTFSGVFTNYKNFDPKSLLASFNCTITNGELIGFEPIKAASKFIRIEELNHIYFSNLSNEILIKNSTITIPLMDIQSNALNLQLKGTHSFDNQINYGIKVNLKKLLAAKFKKNNNDTYIEEDPYEGTNIFLTLKGDISNPSIAYDKSSVKEKMKEDFKKEKETLKNLFKKDSEIQTNKDNSKEDKYFQTKEKPVFIDFEE